MNTISSLVPVYKPVGKTPLECVEEYKHNNHIDPTITVSYAGRLDPMAEGLLLLLVGDANKKRREYEHLPKEYEVTVLVGFATDTGDLMGKLTEVQSIVYKVQSQQKLSFWSEAIESKKKILSSLGSSRMTISSQVSKQLTGVLPSFIGLIAQRYPIYSSAKVHGKPLFWWARKGRLNEIEIPTHKVQIDSIELITGDTIADTALLKYIVESVGMVKGDFRQDEIVKEWKTTLSMSSRPPADSAGIDGSLDGACAEQGRSTRNDKRLESSHRELSLFTLRVACGSGTYMRQLLADIGEKIGVPLCAYKIKRIRVGEYQLSMTKSQ